MTLAAGFPLTPEVGSLRVVLEWPQLVEGTGR